MIVSYLFHPVFMPLYLVVLAFVFNPLEFLGMPMGHILLNGSFANLLSLVFVTGILFPLILIGLMKALGFIGSVHMTNPRDRIMPLMGVMIFYFWIDHLFANLPGIPFVLRCISLGSFWALIALFLFQIFFPVSMHALAAGGMVAYLFLMFWNNPVNVSALLYSGLILAGLIGTARLILHAHRPIEVYLGYGVGGFSFWAAYIYLT